MTDHAPTADTHATDSRALDAPHVWAQVLQNVLGGIGAGVVLAAVRRFPRAASGAIMGAHQTPERHTQ